MKYLSSIGLSVKDENVLKSLIDLLGARMSEEWHYRDDVPADALLLDVDNPDAIATWKMRPETARRNTIAYSNSEPGFALTRRLAKPLRAAELIAVLKDIEQANDELAVPVVGSEATEVTTLADCVDRQGNGVMRLACGDREVVIDRSRQQFCSSESGESLAALLTLPLPEYQISTGADVRLPSEASVRWQDQKAVLWLVGQCGSHGKLLDGVDRNGLFRLNRWPGFGPVRPSHTVLSLCSLLTRKSAMGIADMRETTGLPEFDIIAFINAAFLTGILDIQSGDVARPETGAAKPEVSTERKGLLAKIRSRLANPRT
ncbi:hypothetical protein [Marinobacter mobilis]|uniref:hypothetical protein n=1 Tax=Marinobacter mobilis TaxID=488533 RepID=UPI0035C74333